MRRSCRLPLYHVIMAVGREPELSQVISYLRSATNDDGTLIIFTVSGFTGMRKETENKNSLKLVNKVKDNET